MNLKREKRIDRQEDIEHTSMRKVRRTEKRIVRELKRLANQAPPDYLIT